MPTAPRWHPSFLQRCGRGAARRSQYCVLPGTATPTHFPARLDKAMPAMPAAWPLARFPPPVPGMRGREAAPDAQRSGLPGDGRGAPGAPRFRWSRLGTPDLPHFDRAAVGQSRVIGAQADRFIIVGCLDRVIPAHDLLGFAVRTVGSANLAASRPDYAAGV